ncbi:NmrA-like protein [Neofusicoccum parvum]|uniref:NmrA-like protein n=1 Tax=Neofusicoccum parvum TaxID=310453 RepID=A0ACB5S7H1_9PEZI|nr:NmrA-like protein [Neofusicoccum parvum]GME44165.1 NmrA-like protein [Neofusicoccum parvum]
MSGKAPVEYLITGATGGLGTAILSTLLRSGVPQSQIAVGSSRDHLGSTYEARGLQFRHTDFESITSLMRAFQGVKKLFFVSTNTIDNEKRKQQHRNVVTAAEQAGVGRVYYSSLGIGGVDGTPWDVELMVAHLETERMLRESQLVWTSVREGMYADAFPCFLNWYPKDPQQVLYLPCDGTVAFALREELGEATAKLMMRGGFEKQNVLLTGPRAVKLSSIVNIINTASSRAVRIEYVSDEEYVRRNVSKDIGGKSEAFFRNWVTLLHGFEAGHAAAVSPLMSELLGRPARDGEQAAQLLLRRDRDYTWHQNYLKDGKKKGAKGTITEFMKMGCCMV